jgi:hypothetical protein
MEDQWPNMLSWITVTAAFFFKQEPQRYLPFDQA